MTRGDRDQVAVRDGGEPLEHGEIDLRLVSTVRLELGCLEAERHSRLRDVRQLVPGAIEGCHVHQAIRQRPAGIGPSPSEPDAGKPKVNSGSDRRELLGSAGLDQFAAVEHVHEPVGPRGNVGVMRH